MLICVNCSLLSTLEYSGKRASVYRIRRRAATLSGEYRHHILKAIPLQRRDPETWLFQTASGTKPMQEIKNSVALDRALEGSGVRDFFMVYRTCCGYV